jgi:hypothetical protein
MDTVQDTTSLGKKYGEKNTKMLDPLLRTNWKDIGQSPYEILSTKQETRKPYSIHTKGIKLVIVMCKSCLKIKDLERCPEKDVLLRRTNIKKTST